MKRYDSYKDSGVKCLGEIPSHWEVCRFKNIASLITTPSSDKRKVGLENIESGCGRFLQTDNQFEGNGVQFEVEDVVYGKLRPYLKKVWIASFSGNAVGDFFVFRPDKRINNRYLFYLMLSDSFTDDINSSTYGAKMPRVSSEYILTLGCAVPLITEQEAIANYLDAVTSKIDDAIAQQQKMIDLLNERKQIIINNAVTKGLNPNVKMKPSGIDWIGDIPEHWDVFKTLYALSMPITDGPHETPELLESGIPFISAEAISGGSIDFSHKRGYVSEAFYRDCCKKYIPQLHDVYMIKSGATTGKTAIVETEDIFTIWSPLAVFRANKDVINPYFLLNALRATYYTKQVELNWSYGTQQNIGMRILEKLLLCVPPVLEQIAILDYIDSSIIPINKAIECANKQISLLQERKQIIINDVVTGKVKVC